MGGQGSRYKILLCARSRFYRVGYLSTSVDDILQECGVAKSNFYYHFKTKEALGIAVLDLYFDEIEAVLAESLYDRSLSPAVRLNRFCDGLCHSKTPHQRMGGCPLGNFVAAMPTEGDEQAERFRERLRGLFQKLEQVLCDCFAEGASQGEFRDDIPPAELAAFTLGTLEGMLLLIKAYQDPAPLQSALSVLQRLLRGS